MIVDNVSENPEEIIMADAENRGDGIHIPAYLISFEDGAKINKYIADEDDIVISVSLEIGTENNIVEYDLWYSSPFDFLKFDISKIGLANYWLSKAAKFEPRIYTYQCINCTD